MLFPPERTEGGFRLYTDKHIERLKQIINARDVLGISLQELQEFISINEEFNHQREDIKQIQDPAAKLEKLTEIRSEIGLFYKRVSEAKQRIKSNQEWTGYGRLSD